MGIVESMLEYRSVAVKVAIHYADDDVFWHVKS